MRAITVHPLKANSIELRDVPEPPADNGALLVEAIALGVCGTDREIIAGDYGEAPDDSERLILGHESLGRVREAPGDSDFKRGDHVVGIVRQPDPVPCPACAAGQWDMCRNGQYTEHGIKGLNGFGAERWRIDPAFAVKVDPALGLNAVLMEPTSVVAKAWDHAHRLWRLAAARRNACSSPAPGRSACSPRCSASSAGSTCMSTITTRADRSRRSPRRSARPITATSVDELAQSSAPDIVIECTGVPDVIATLLPQVAPDSLICLTGVGASRRTEFDIGLFNRNMVLNNGAVFGSVNANLRHYQMAADALARADRAWLVAPDHPPRAARALRGSVRASQGRHQDRDRVRAHDPATAASRTTR